MPGNSYCGNHDLEGEPPDKTLFCSVPSKQRHHMGESTPHHKCVKYAKQHLDKPESFWKQLLWLHKVTAN